MKRAVFFDRDGVLVEDVHLLQKEEDIVLVKGMEDFIAEIKSEGFLAIMVSNQTVVSRGLLSLADCEKLNYQICQRIEQQNSLAVFDQINLCPYHPHAQVEEYRQDSPLRKPKPGMLLKAAEEFNIDLQKSFMIGDRVSDIIAGNTAGCFTILYDSKMTNEKKIISDFAHSKEMEAPNLICKSPQELSRAFRSQLL